MAYKPGSVHLAETRADWMTIPLGRLLPATSSDLPEHLDEISP